MILPAHRLVTGAPVEPRTNAETVMHLLTSAFWAPAGHGEPLAKYPLDMADQSYN
jgi:hypothetical protein